MSIAGRVPHPGTLSLPSPRSSLDAFRAWAHVRLTAVFNAAQEIPFDDSSRIVFFSDSHRGDNSRADCYAGNEALFLQTLSHYLRDGYTYVEVGDGDDMWKNRRFEDILRAHPRTFDLLAQFHDRGRLHLLFGNHDTLGFRHNPVRKNGWTAQEALVLRHARTGQKIFAVHGHQADFKSDGLRVVGKFAVRHLWRRLQLLGLNSAWLWMHTQGSRRASRGGRPAGQGIQRFWISQITQARHLCERRIMSWGESRGQIVVCGHTHRPMIGACGAPPYFNTGSCVVPGVITGLEVTGGELRLVKWVAAPGSHNGSGPQVKRMLMAPPRKLRRLVT